MNPSEVLRIVDTIHRDKNIDKEIVFEGIEAALVSAAKKHFGEDQEIVVQIDRTDGSITGTRNGAPMDPTEMAERIGAQTAKQVMIRGFARRSDALRRVRRIVRPTRDRCLSAARGAPRRDPWKHRGNPAQESRFPAERTYNNECAPPSARSCKQGRVKTHPQPNSPISWSSACSSNRILEISYAT